MTSSNDPVYEGSSFPHSAADLTVARAAALESCTNPQTKVDMLTLSLKRSRVAPRSAKMASEALPSIPQFEHSSRTKHFPQINPTVMSGYSAMSDSNQPIQTVDVDVEAQGVQDVSTPVRTGAWDAEFCGCCDYYVPNCCMATFLPCISMAQIAHRIDVYSFWSVLLGYLALEVAAIVLTAQSMQSSDDYHYYESDFESYLSSVNAISLALCAVASLVVCQFRATIRSRYQIPGSCCGDCIVSFCCSCCTIAQMATHVKSYTPGSCDFGPPEKLPPHNQSESQDTLPAYN